MVEFPGFERELIRERTRAGLPAHAESTAMAAETLYCERRLNVNDIAKRLSIAKSTLCRYLRQRGVEVGKHVRRDDAISPH